MRVLIISHAYIAPENRHKITLLGQYDDLEIGVLFPSRWEAMGRPLHYFVQSEDTKQHWTFTCPVVSCGDGAKYFYDPSCLWGNISQFRPDIIHIEEEPWSRVCLEMAIVSRLLKSKLTFFSWENLDLPLSPFQKKIRQFVFYSSSAALAGSSEAKNCLENNGFKKEIQVIPQFGADIEKFYPLSPESRTNQREKLGIEGFVVGFVGRFVEEKGIGVLLRAVAELLKTNKDTKLLLVSTTIFPKELQDMSRDLGVSDCLVVADGLDHSRLVGYVQSMDCLVLPSLTTPTWKEQFGRVLTEAMACAVPVIGSSSGAIPEVIGDAGLTFKEGVADDLADQINKYYQDEDLRERMGQAGLERVKRAYSFNAVTEESREFFIMVGGS